MRKTLTLFAALSLTLSACGAIRDSRVNPFNWFGQSRSVATTAPESTNPLIPRSNGFFSRGRANEEIYLGRPFEQVTDLTVERVPGGAIIRATGLAARQGIYAVQLTPANEDEEPVNGVLTYRLEGVRPKANTPVGTVPTREVTAGRKLTDQQLRNVDVIRVEGALNAQETRRR
ncbi:hypothetical protein BOO69_07425 [Sulfitobacter alexandrii]|uniref:Lipoprotein n=1 Tax=Sulfitobacter alexandrii TaxID=1917485 RepID=A0A1J0WG26_9RHOB|nr:hypothetical protein [Sulfitobacter alexandrii]APE43266.1 hypothetical protein BOO69_07425 [Sulfitobacter alexandrii]